ncbi:hypothetical protein SMICM17S_06343 [Streptomyces microflavus]
MEELAELSERTFAEREAADFAGEFMDLPEIADHPEDSPSWPRPAAATPRTRTSSPYRHRWSPTTSAP